MRATILLSVLAWSASVNAQVFTSDLETWNDTLPAGWIGAKTNLNLDSIDQVTVNPHGGSFAVRLKNPTINNKRFTTQPLAMNVGETYTFDFWVRGTGEVHVALYDARTGNSGYSDYSDYVIIANASTWQEVTAIVACTNTTAAGEFIIGCRNTTGPEHLVVDDVNIILGSVPQNLSIYDIQYTTDGGGASPVSGSAVITAGVVTGAGASGYFIQDGDGPWNGIWVSDTVNGPAVGDLLQLSAVVNESGGNTRLRNLFAYSVASSGNALPIPSTLSPAQANTEEHEGVLVAVVNMPCVLTNDIYGEWKLYNGTDTVRVDDLLYPYTGSVGSSYSVTGCLFYSFGAFKIEPRSAADVDVFNSVAEVNARAALSVYPNPATDVLNIRLSDVLRISTGLPIGMLANYTLTDALGRTVRRGTLNGNGTIAVDDLISGFYHLTLRAANGVKSFAVEVR